MNDSLGNQKLKEILKAAEEQGKHLTIDDLHEIFSIGVEIDRLYDIIKTNQEAFGVFKILIETDEE